VTSSSEDQQVAAAHDVAILGAGISGLSAAHYAAVAGLDCVVLDAAVTPGGCIHTARTPEGFWFELGAHTLYNSYGSLLGIIESLGLRDQLQPRSKAPYRLWVDGKVRSVPSQLAMGELFASAWRAFTAKKEGRSVGDYYGRLVGKRNWRRVFSPLLSAVPSQRADDFPAEMLFKRRPRRKDFPRTFTFKSGLGMLVDRLASRARVTLRMRAKVQSLAKAGDGFAIGLDDGTSVRCRRLVLALPPPEAARLVAPILPRCAAALDRVRTAAIVSTGVVLAKTETAFPRLAGLVPLDDVFFSAVSRDVVDDPHSRGLAFHFRTGLSPEERLDRIATVTGTPRRSFQHVVEHASVLPSPEVGHPDIVADVDQAIAGTGLYVTGNYFGGLAIEDCVLRSSAEVGRLLAESSPST
jgi:oxygen-dependent protoporphyrinogen oxidase